jgi:hypothetical protein
MADDPPDEVLFNWYFYTSSWAGSSSSEDIWGLGMLAVCQFGE